MPEKKPPQNIEAEQCLLGCLMLDKNAITRVARSNNSSEGATLYVTSSPCIECSKLIIQAGIKRVVYADSYRLSDGIDLLERAGIDLVSVEIK